ncbi:MAG TPA: Ig-like domain-containing protein [Candidatus Saccharimonadales bacterium]|nr:Ig-like domain-containing protein [Candidatus Saccharimonadales bacterium]
MKIQRLSTAIFGGVSIALRLAILPVFVLALAVLPADSAKAAGGFTFSPNGGNLTVGSNLTVAIRVNTGSEQTHAVTAEFSYPENLLEYVGTDSGGSNFNVAAAEKGGNGLVHYTRGSSDPVNGDLLVQKANFRVIGAGTATLRFTDDTMAVSAKDGKTNVATNKPTASFTLSAAPTNAATPPPVSNPPQPAAKTTQQPRYVTRITPITSNNTPAEPIELMNNEVVELTAPIDVQPATIQSDGISKVEYYLDGRLVKTVTVSPYRYRVDTTKLLNGNHRLTTKTYYTNGQTESVNQILNVKNPFGITQVRLLAVKYFWVLFLTILLIVGIVIALIVRGRSQSGGTSGGGYNGVDPTYISPNTTPGAPTPYQ